MLGDSTLTADATLHHSLLEHSVSKTERSLLKTLSLFNIGNYEFYNWVIIAKIFCSGTHKPEILIIVFTLG